MEILNLKQLNKGALLAKFDAKVPEWHLTLKGCTLFEKQGRRWISLPQREFMAEDGSKKHAMTVEFDNKEIKEKFEAACMKLLNPMIMTIQPTQEQQGSNDVPF